MVGNYAISWRKIVSIFSHRGGTTTNPICWWHLRRVLAEIRTTEFNWESTIREDSREGCYTDNDGENMGSEQDGHFL